MIYLDWASTTPILDSLAESMPEWEKNYFGNPAAIHAEGRRSETFLNKARENLATCAGCAPEEILFTSGATEANNMVIFSLLNRLPGGKGDEKRSRPGIILSGIEHPSFYDAARQATRLGFETRIIRAENSGIIDPVKVLKELDNQTMLVSLMLVNNETGAIQPVQEIAKGVKEFNRSRSRKVLIHTDAVQAFTKIPFNFRELGVDSASLSAHKIRGPKGSGALIRRVSAGYDFLFKGGEQEAGQRPGTENLVGHHAFAFAAEAALCDREADYKQAEALMTDFCRRVLEIKPACLIPSIRSTGHSPSYSPYILKIAFPPIPGEVLVRVLEDKGFLVSTGSACSSRNRDKRQRVLQNMQVPAEIAASSIRISTGRPTTAEEFNGLIRVLKQEIPLLMKLAG